MGGDDRGGLSEEVTSDPSLEYQKNTFAIKMQETRTLQVEETACAKVLPQWFSIRENFVLRSSDIFCCHNQVSATGIWWIQTRNAAKCPTVHWTAPHDEELLDPKCH